MCVKQNYFSSLGGIFLMTPATTRYVAVLAMSGAALAANPVAVMNTSMGVFKAELFIGQMPLTVSNFIDLAQAIQP